MTEQFVLISNIIQLVFMVLGVAAVVWKLFSPQPQKQDPLSATQQAADSAVAFVEQKMPDLDNEEKQKKAVDLVETILQTVGYKNVPPEVVETTIEASVFTLKQGVKAYQALKQQLTAAGILKPATLRATVQDLTNKPQ